MMKRRVFLWMGLVALFLSFGICRETLAKGYNVKKGDTVAAIAKKHGVSPQELKIANGLEGDALKINQALVIPQRAKQKTTKSKKTSSPLASYTVKKGDTISGISRKTGVTANEIREYNNLRSNSLKVGQKILLAKAEKSQGKSVHSSGNSEAEEEDGDLAGEPPVDVNLAEAEKDKISSDDFLGKWHDTEEPKLFVKVATAFLGAPYRLGGMSLKGLDCSAFVKKIYQLFDVSLPRTAKEQAHVGVRVAKDELREGDLVFFNTKRSFGHVGIYIGNNEFVHASSLTKSVRISKLDQPYFLKRFVRAVRLKELDGEVL